MEFGKTPSLPGVGGEGGGPLLEAAGEVGGGEGVVFGLQRDVPQAGQGLRLPGHLAKSQDRGIGTAGQPLDGAVLG